MPLGELFMASILELIYSQFANLPKILRIARYENKAAFAKERLGILWQYINPLVQIFTYSFVFIIGLRARAPIHGIPYLIWMAIGIATWSFMSATFIGTLDAIQSKVRMISKMKFDLSNLVTIKIVQALPAFFSMIGVIMLMAIYYKIYPSLYWLQIIYYIFAAVVFLFVAGIFNASITAIFPDYKPAVRAVMRSLFWFSGAIWNIETLPNVIANVLRLNPFFYVINGMRDSLIGKTWFYHRPFETMSFWVVVGILLVVSTNIYLKNRDRFVDGN